MTLHFSLLPPELQEGVFNFLTPKELGILVPLVCKDWQELASSEQLWKSCFQAQFQGTPSEVTTGWRALFKEMTQQMADFRWAHVEPTITVNGSHCGVLPGVGPWRSAATKISFSSGVHYWEIKVVKWVAKAYVVSLQIGVLEESTIRGGNLETDVLGWIAGRQMNYSASLYSGATTYAQGDVIGVLLNLDGPCRWIAYYKNGSFVAHGYVIPPTWGRVYPAVAFDDGSEVELIPYAFPPYPLPPTPAETLPEPAPEPDYFARAFAEMQLASALEGREQTATFTMTPAGDDAGLMRYEIRIHQGTDEQGDQGGTPAPQLADTNSMTYEFIFPQVPEEQGDQGGLAPPQPDNNNGDNDNEEKKAGSNTDEKKDEEKDADDNNNAHERKGSL